MAGLFEIYVDAERQHRFRLLDAARRPLAEASTTYLTKTDALDAVTAVREAAACGHIVERQPQGSTTVPKPHPQSARPQG